MLWALNPSLLETVLRETAGGCERAMKDCRRHEILYIVRRSLDWWKHVTFVKTPWAFRFSVCNSLPADDFPCTVVCFRVDNHQWYCPVFCTWHIGRLLNHPSLGWGWSTTIYCDYCLHYLMQRNKMTALSTSTAQPSRPRETPASYATQQGSPITSFNETL